MALVYNNQLNEKNLRNVYQFLNPKSRSALKLKHLHSALKPHIQRLKLDRGTERDTLESIIAKVCANLKRLNASSTAMSGTEESKNHGSD